MRCDRLRGNGLLLSCDSGMAVECVLDPCLLLGLEERVVHERILDAITVDGHVTFELGVLPFQLEVILNDVGEQ